MTNNEIKLKIGLVGESGVGKSCCLVRWVDNDFFEENDKYTIGVDFKNKTVICKGKTIKLNIYDTAGQERFRTVTASFYRGTHGVLLTFDLTNKESFLEKQKIEEWLKEIKNYTPDATPIVLIGNKADLSSQRQISYEEAKNWADSKKLPYFETSAKTGSNINEAFMCLVEKIIDLKFQEEKSSTLDLTKKEKKKSSC